MRWRTHSSAPERRLSILRVRLPGCHAHQADGGTHVASTAMVGRVEVVEMESKGRGFRRLPVRIT
jgi:Ser-tRNA(Ala) deacylase AlaX